MTEVRPVSCEAGPNPTKPGRTRRPVNEVDEAAEPLSGRKGEFLGQANWATL